MRLIEVRALTKTYRLAQRQLGLRGAFRHLVHQRYEIHARKSLFHPDNHIGNFARVFQDFSSRMKSRHLVVDNSHANGIRTAVNIAMSHTQTLPDQRSARLFTIPAPILIASFHVPCLNRARQAVSCKHGRLFILAGIVAGGFQTAAE